MLATAAEYDRLFQEPSEMLALRSRSIICPADVAEKNHVIKAPVMGCLSNVLVAVAMDIFSRLIHL